MRTKKEILRSIDLLRTEETIDKEMGLYEIAEVLIDIRDVLVKVYEKYKRS